MIRMWLYPFAQLTPKVRAMLPTDEPHKWAIAHTTHWYMLGRDKEVVAILGLSPPSLTDTFAWLWGRKVNDSRFTVREIRQAKQLIRWIISQSPYELGAFTDNEAPMLGHFSRFLGWVEVARNDLFTYYEVT